MLLGIVVVAAIVAVALWIATPFVICWDDRRHGLRNIPRRPGAFPPDDAVAAAGRVRHVLKRDGKP